MGPKHQRNMRKEAQLEPLGVTTLACPTRDQSTALMRADTISRTVAAACSAPPHHLGSVGKVAFVQPPPQLVRPSHCAGTSFRLTVGDSACPDGGSVLQGSNDANKWTTNTRAPAARREAIRQAWSLQHCGEYTKGDRLTAKPSHKLIFDIGFHSGDDTLYFLEQGHDVVAVDANPEMLRVGGARPTLQVAKASGRLHTIARGIVETPGRDEETLRFYVHRKVSEWSFSTPRANKIGLM